MHTRLLALFMATAILPLAALETDRQFGDASYKFLKLPLSPRVVALGGAGVALVDGTGEMDLNPAAVASDSGRLVVGKGYPFSEFQSNSSHISWSIPWEGYRVLLNARYLGFKDLPGFNEQNEATSAYGAHTLKAQGGLAGKFQDLHWGATLNYASNNIANANYATAMLNAGARYQIISNLLVGGSVVNADFWHSRAKNGNNSDPFPPTALQAGMAYTKSIGPDFKAGVAVDARTRNDEELVWPMGLEVSWKQMLFARAGFPVGEQEPALAAGLGLSWSIFQFQYAYQGHATLSPAHYWTLDIRY